MTRFFFRLIGFFAFIILLLIVGTRLVGSLRPPLPLKTVMAKPDGSACDRPCLFRIRPGETSVEQAVQILNSHPLTRDAKWINDHILQLTGPNAFVVFSRTEEGLVDNITFTDNLDDIGQAVPGSLADSIALGELILAYGTPNVGLPGSNYFVTEFDDIGVTAAVARPYKLKSFVKPENHISMLMVTFLQTCSTPMNFELHSWMGFKTFSKYMSDTNGYTLQRRNSNVSIPPYAICPK